MGEILEAREGRNSYRPYSVILRAIHRVVGKSLCNIAHAMHAQLLVSLVYHCPFEEKIDEEDRFKE